MIAFSLLGYIRFAIVLVAHCITDDNPVLALVLYLVFGILDGIDGWAARKLNQCSSFGAWVCKFQNGHISVTLFTYN